MKPIEENNNLINEFLGESFDYCKPLKSAKKVNVTQAKLAEIPPIIIALKSKKLSHSRYDTDITGDLTLNEENNKDMKNKSKDLQKISFANSKLEPIILKNTNRLKKQLEEVRQRISKPITDNQSPINHSKLIIPTEELLQQNNNEPNLILFKKPEIPNIVIDTVPITENIQPKNIKSPLAEMIDNSILNYLGNNMPGEHEQRSNKVQGANEKTLDLLKISQAVRTTVGGSEVQNAQIDTGELMGLTQKIRVSNCEDKDEVMVVKVDKFLDSQKSSLEVVKVEGNRQSEDRFSEDYDY